MIALGGYSIQDIAASARPTPPQDESRDWYQYYFHSQRGRACITLYRWELTAQLWREWSLARPILDADLKRTAPSFDKPDFVDVVIHSYRHRFGLAPGAEEHEDDERFLAGLPTVDVPAIVLDPPRTRRCTPARASSTTLNFPTSSTTGRSPAVITSRSTHPPKSPSPCATCTHSWTRRRTAGKPGRGSGAYPPQASSQNRVSDIEAKEPCG